MTTEVRERFSEPAATKLTPRQVAAANLAMTLSKLLLADDPNLSFKGEREGQGDTAAFYRQAILYFTREILVQARVKMNGNNLLDVLESSLNDDPPAS